MPLQHGFVKCHDAMFVLRRERLIEMLVVRHFILERENEADPPGIPDMEQNVSIFFGLEKRDRMDLVFAERSPVVFVKASDANAHPFCHPGGRPIV